VNDVFVEKLLVFGSQSCEEAGAREVTSIGSQ